MVGEGETFRFLRRSYPLVPDHCGARVARLSGLLGSPIDVLAGAPLFRDHAIRFEWEEGTVRFSDRLEPVGGERLAVQLRDGCPEVEAEVAGIPFRVVLDTGASISYVPEHVLDRGVPGAPYDDFHPIGGRFRTPTAILVHRLGNGAVSARSGRLESLPPLLRASLEVGGGDKALVGMSAIRPLDVAFDLGRGAIHIAPRPYRGPEGGATGVP